MLATSARDNNNSNDDGAPVDYWGAGLLPQSQSQTHTQTQRGDNDNYADDNDNYAVGIDGGFEDVRNRNLKQHFDYSARPNSTSGVDGGESTGYGEFADVSLDADEDGDDVIESELFLRCVQCIMMRKFTNFENVYHIYCEFTSIYW
jgi:hypothetical protein